MRKVLLAAVLTINGGIAFAAGPSNSKIDMVTIPAGCFESETVDVGKICLDSFQIGKYVVTQGQYKRIMGKNPSENKQCGNNCPVVNVSWDDAQAFIAKLNRKSGKHYRLPTSAEMEFACRDGGKASQYCGSDNLDEVAWYEKNSGLTLHPVGQKKPTKLGLYDISGNVWQWTQNWFGDTSDLDRGKNPQGPVTGTSRTKRGASFHDGSGLQKPGFCFSAPPDLRDSETGFRLAAPVE